MSKYKVKFKLQGLEFEIEGEKDAVPNIAGGIRNQFAALMSPIDVAGKADTPASPATPYVIESTSSSRRKSGGKRAPRTTSESTELPAFNYNPETHGAPVQDWKAVDKAFWLLRVLTDSGTPEVPGTVLAEVFAKHFRRKGSLRPSNISRDFGKVNGLVAENTNVEPAAWYLLDGGIKHTDTLIAQALTPSEVAA